MTFFHGLIALFFLVFLASFLMDDAYVQYRNRMRITCGIGFSFAAFMIWRMNRLWAERDARDGMPPDARLGHSPRAQHVIFLSIWLVVYPGYLMLIALSVGKLSPDDIAGHVYVFGFAISFIVANTILAATNFSAPRSYWKIPAMGAFLTAFYLSIPSNPLSITRAVFVSLGIGDIGKSQFVVKRQTCDAVNLIVPGACDIASDSAGCIRPQSLANRIGSEYLLVLKAPMKATMAAGVASTNTARRYYEIRIPIAKTDVLVWGAVDADKVAWPTCKLPEERKAAPTSR